MEKKQIKGRFTKGKSGNPGGRPKKLEDVKELAATYTKDAIERLAYWMKTDDSKASISASTALLNRAWGMPTAPVEHTGKDGEAIQTENYIRPALTRDEWLNQHGLST